jgi:hypothetical protein
LLAVAYSDIFDYPLTAREIHRYCSVKASVTEVYTESRGFRFLRCSGEFFTLPGREPLVFVRTRREEISSRLWPQAIRYGRLISSLPFVRMVAVTGSLAVDNADAPSDIDYLIVTAPGRLWTCRAMILAVVRLAARRGLNLCPNYIISTRALEFPNRNLYAARELAQMVPISGLEVYAEIRRRNAWVADFLPNADGLPLAPVPVDLTRPASWLRLVIEAVMRTPPWAGFERWEMNRKVRKLSRLQGENGESVFSADVCKGHDQGHQFRTQTLLDSKVSRLLTIQHQEILDSQNCP